MKTKILFLLFIVCSITYAQDFTNGDLDGTINGNSSLPTGWQNVPYTDVNCQALHVGNDTPDLTSLTQPSPTIGMNGNPFSGNTFVSGTFGSNPPNFFQEGIMQTVNGFITGQEYLICFRQTVAKSNYSLDEFGSWAVYIDTGLVGITMPTHGKEPFGSISLIWELRTVSFIATATSHLIKFLPLDDDSNYVGSFTDTTGALRMGIDSIGLVAIIDGLGSTTSYQGGEAFKVIPNPSKGSFKLQYSGIISNALLLSITDVYGKLIDVAEITSVIYDYENTNLNNGLYFYSIRNKEKEIGRGKIVVQK